MAYIFFRHRISERKMYMTELEKRIRIGILKSLLAREIISESKYYELIKKENI